MVKTRGVGLIPAWGTKIPPASGQLEKALMLQQKKEEILENNKNKIKSYKYKKKSEYFQERSIICLWEETCMLLSYPQLLLL